MIPLQLRRELAFKRGYIKRNDQGDQVDSAAQCRVMGVISDAFIVVDGLNGNVDIFSLLDFRYIGTLDINESSLSAMLYIEEVPTGTTKSARLYLASQSRQLFCFEVQTAEQKMQDIFKLVHIEETSQNITQMITFVQKQSRNNVSWSLLCVEEQAEIEIFDLQSSVPSKFRLYSSKRPVIEGGAIINQCLKT